MRALIAVLLLAAFHAQPAPFRLEETTVARIQSALRDGPLTCRSLVEQYLRRIDADDKRGAKLNAIVMINPDALKIADELDRRYRQSGPVDKAPKYSLDDIVKSRQFHPSIQVRLESAQTSDDVPGETPGCKSRDEFREKLRTAVLKLIEDQRLDALIYPTWSNPPRLIGDLNTPGGDNN